MSKHEYNDLLFEISRKIDAAELKRLVFMCRDDLAKGSKDSIKDVLTLFEELEKQNYLGIDHLDTLKNILALLKKKSLLKKVKEFEITRKGRFCRIAFSPCKFVKPEVSHAYTQECLIFNVFTLC